MSEVTRILSAIDCAKTAERLASTENVAGVELAIWGCTLAPDAVSDYTPLVQAAEKLVAGRPKDFTRLNGLGALLYRAGRFEDTVQRLNEARAAYTPADERRTTIAYNNFFLAMAHHRLGHAEEARQWLHEAVRNMEQPQQEKQATAGGAAIPWNRRLALQILRREAEELMGMNDK